MIFCNHIDPPEENLPHPFSMVHPIIHPVFGAQLVCHVNLSHEIVAIINDFEPQTINFQQRPSLLYPIFSFFVHATFSVTVLNICAGLV